MLRRMPTSTSISSIAPTATVRRSTLLTVRRRSSIGWIETVEAEQASADGPQTGAMARRCLMVWLPLEERDWSTPLASGDACPSLAQPSRSPDYLGVITRTIHRYVSLGLPASRIKG